MQCQHVSAAFTRLVGGVFRRARGASEPRCLRIASTLVALALVAVLLGVSPSARAAGSDSNVVVAFEQARAFIATLPDAELAHGLRTSLEQKLRAGEAAFARGKQCAAAGILGAYLAEAQALRRRAPVAEDLFNRGWRILTLLPPGPCAVAGVGAQPRIDVQTSDTTRFAATIDFGAPALSTFRDARRGVDTRRGPRNRLDRGHRGRYARPAGRAPPDRCAEGCDRLDHVDPDICAAVAAQPLPVSAV